MSRADGGPAWDGIAPGLALPELRLDVSYSRVILNVGAGRDFMRGHHEPAYAAAQGIETIYVNTFFHQAFVDRMLTDWAGPAAMIRRRRIAMLAPLCAGIIATGTGWVVAKRCEGGRRMVDLELAITNGKELCCDAKATIEFISPSRCLA